MRIVAGEYRGRTIESPSEATTRPTTDRVRESMFSSINSRMDIEGACVLDAFAGSGALGIEALSRGAVSATFFEQDEKARKVLQGNLGKLGLRRPKATVVGADVFASAQRPLHGTQPFSLVLLDPPYAIEPAQVLGFVATLAAQGDLADKCCIAYEHAVTNKAVVAELLEVSDLFEEDGQKKYGKVGVTYIAYRAGRE